MGLRLLKIFYSFSAGIDFRRQNAVSVGHCHLIYLTTLKRFSWPSLADMCTKVAHNLIHSVGISKEETRTPFTIEELNYKYNFILYRDLNQNVC